MDTISSPPHDPQAWREELASLLAQPIQIEEEIHREGDLIGVHITPLHVPGQTTVDLLVTLFFLTLSSSQAHEAEAQRIALEDYLDDLQDPDYHIRMAACRALGQLGDASALAALRRAEQDENRYVRAAATQALVTLTKPRFQREELASVPLSLWQQVRHLWKPLVVVQTNHRGQARFKNISMTGNYRLQVRARAQQGRSTLATQTAPIHEEEQLAAAEGETQPQPLPPPQQLVLENGSLFCSFSRDEEEQLVVEFRSDAAQLSESWVHFRIVRQDTHEEIVNNFVQLEVNRLGVAVGRFVFTEALDFSPAHELFFEPLPLIDQEG
jgi:hypothetical protein